MLQTRTARNKGYLLHVCSVLLQRSLISAVQQVCARLLKMLRSGMIATW